MAKWLLVFSMVVLTGAMSGCQKKAVQDEASIPVEEAVDAALTENQEISQSDEMAAVVDENAQTTTTEAVSAEVPVVEATVNAVPTPQDIQTALKNAGYYNGAVDGNIGPKTKQAIKDFQYKNNLSVDGKVGPKTWKKLSSYIAQASSAVAPVTEASQGITEVPAAQ